MDDADTPSIAASEEVEEEEKIDSKTAYHLQLEDDFVRVSELIENIPELRPIADDYIRTFEAYREQYNQCQKLSATVDELNVILAENNRRVEEALKKGIENEKLIAELQSKLDYTYRVADAAHAREQKAQEVIDNLRKQISRLTADVEAQNKLPTDMEEDPAAAKQKESVQRERDRLAGEVDQLKQRIQLFTTYQEELERKHSAADARINVLSLQVEEETGSKNKLIREKEGLEDQVKNYLEETAKLNNKVEEMSTKIEHQLIIISKNEAKITELTNTIDELHKEKEHYNTKLAHLQENYDKVKLDNKKINESYTSQTEHLSRVSHELKVLRKELTGTKATITSLELEIKSTNEKKAFLENEHVKFRSSLGLMQKEADMLRRKADTDKRYIDNLTRERDILSKNIRRAETLSLDHIKIIKIQEQTKRKLENEVAVLTRDMQKHKKQISALEKERDRLLAEILDLTKSVKEAIEENGVKQSEIFEYKKQLVETDSRVRTIQNLFDSIRTERNNLQKTLQETQNDVTELKSKLKMSVHQCEQLKEDITSKEEQLIKVDNSLRKANKIIETLKVDVQNGLDRLKEAKNEINELKEEIKSLHKSIWTQEDKIKHLAKEIEQIMNERDILGSQLVRRNDELTLVYEKINILERTLQIGEKEYAQRIDDIRLLKIEIKRLRQEKSLLTKAVLNTTDLQLEVFNLERDLTRERLKCRALEEEVQNPLNIHRWRKLEGSDPSTMELIQKIQILQRRVLRQTQELVEKEKQLKDSAYLYNRLQDVIKKQPLPGFQDKLASTQRRIKDREVKMKGLVSELNLSEAKSEEYKMDIERLKKELLDYKQKYFQLKKEREIFLQRSGTKLPAIDDKKCQCSKVNCTCKTSIRHQCDIEKEDRITILECDD